MNPFAALLCALSLGLPWLSAAAPAPAEISVPFEAGQNIREVAKTHLKDPDLWPDILRTNGIESIDQLKPGSVLRIPAQLILQATAALRQAQAVIDQAASAGARVLAADPINAAVARHGEALAARQRGDWPTALSQAQAAVASAREALQQTQQQRNLALHAVLERAGGTVQRRSPADAYWQPATVSSSLPEQEKLRTLAASYAEVVFHDNSRLRLNENAQLVVQSMRLDTLNQRESTRVLLQEGDLYALLGGNPQSKKLEISLPGIETQNTSRDFWVGKTPGNDTRIANYDGGGEIQLGSDAQAVLLKQNQGALVKNGRLPDSPTDLLPPPDGLLPPDHATVYRDGVALSWRGPAEARGYWLEIASDRDFSHTLVSAKDLREARYWLPLPADGLYYWRTASIDGDGLPGAKSKTAVFKVQRDQQPPYLSLSEPPPGTQWVRQPHVAVRGHTEAGASVQLDGQDLAVAADGGFSFDFLLQPGTNRLRLEATDPAGNRSHLERSIIYSPDDAVPLRFDPALPQLDASAETPWHFVVNRPGFTLRGQTLAGTGVKLRGEDGDQVAGFADAQGHFQLNLRLRADSNRFQLEVRLPSGHQQTSPLRIDLDTTPPPLHLPAPPPGLTAEPRLKLSGQAEGAARLELNGEPVALDAEGGFSAVLDLRAGDNPLRLSAYDLAGNRSGWEKTVRLDTQAPQLLSHSLSLPRVRGGETVQISVKASDPSGLKAGARFELSAGDYQASGVLRLTPDRQTYQGELSLPAHAQGRVRLQGVYLEDQLGNSARYNPR